MGTAAAKPKRRAPPAHHTHHPHRSLGGGGGCAACTHAYGDTALAATMHDVLARHPDGHSGVLSGGARRHACSVCASHTSDASEASMLHQLLSLHPHGHDKVMTEHVRQIMSGGGVGRLASCGACTRLNMSQHSSHAFHALFHPSTRARIV